MVVQNLFTENFDLANTYHRLGLNFINILTKAAEITGVQHRLFIV